MKIRRSFTWMALSALLPTVGGCAVEAGTPESGGGGYRGGDGGAGGRGGGANVEGMLTFAPSNLDGTTPLEEQPGDFVLERGRCEISTSEATDDVCDSQAELFVVEQNDIDRTKLAVLAVHDFHVGGNALIDVVGANPLLILATGEAFINGEVYAGADSIFNESGGPGGFNSPSEDDQPGRGPGAGGAPIAPIRARASGGGGGAHCGAGGAGGSTDGAGDNGGTPFGSPEIAPLRGGSSGASGASEGGGGGGALQISAATSITVGELGTIWAPGQGGNGWGGGGGAGGAILLEAQTVHVAGTLAVNGGGGATGGDLEDAERGRRHAVAASGSHNSTSDPYHGGKGGAGTTIEGSAGRMDSSAGPDSHRRGGGGGGGVGWIRINTADGTADLQGTLSPALSTDCTSLGTLP